MSTGLEVKAHVEAGRLRELAPRSGGSRYRVVALEPSVAAAFTGPWPPGSDDERIMPRFKQQLDNFILNRPVAATFRKEPPVELRRLQAIRGVRSRTVWEFRYTPSGRPSDHLRLFGCFAEVNYFVGLSLQGRAGLDFDSEIRKTHSAWRTLFPDAHPVATENIHDYVSMPVTFFG